MVLPLSCSALRISACRRARGAADSRTSETKTAFVPRGGWRTDRLRASAAPSAAGPLAAMPAELAPHMAVKFLLRLLDVALNLLENFVHGEFALDVRLGV